MIIFRRIPNRHRLNRRDNRFWPIALRARNRGARLGRLRVILNEQRRAILGANIIALTVKLRRIMRREMNVENIAVTNQRGILSHSDRLGMASIAAAHLLVCRVDDRATDIATLNRDHPGQILEHRLNTPKTAASNDAC